MRTNSSRTLQAVFRFLRCNHGAAMVEFALVVMVVFMPVMMGVFEFGRRAWAKTTITAAAREGVRYAIVHGSTSGSVADSATIANYVIGRTQLSGIMVRPSWTGTKSPGDTATVRVSYSYVPIIKLFPSDTIKSTSTQIIAY